MTSIDFEVQEELLTTLEKSAREHRDRAVQLRQEAGQLDKDSEDTLKVRSEHLRELVTAELVRRNLSCCGCCGKVTNEVTVCSVYESSNPAWFTIWRLCEKCQKAGGWEFSPQIVSSGGDMTVNKLLCLLFITPAPQLSWKNLTPVSAKEAFLQLKELAAQEERQDPKDIPPEMRYKISDR